MEVWHIWIIVALILVIVAGIEGQLIWFSVVTVISFVTVRPFLLRLFHRTASDRKSGVDALKGREAIVTERISAADNTGRAAIDGDDWKAVSEPDEVIEKGTRVIVTDVDSVVLKVRRK